MSRATAIRRRLMLLLRRPMLLLSMLLAMPVFAVQPGGAVPPPPEIKKTVDAVVGEWAGPMTAVVPGAPPETFAWAVECKAVALGSGAACTMSGTASIGPLAQACLVAYDPGSKELHHMCVTSMGEVHDHRGHWTSGQAIEFAPLRGFMGGKPIVETVQWSFPDDKTFFTRSVVRLEDGSSMTFEFTGKRK